jgi:hypothetical protein
VNTWPKRLIDGCDHRIAAQSACEPCQDALAYLDHQKRLRDAQRTPGGRLGRFLATVVWVWRQLRRRGRS